MSCGRPDCEAAVNWRLFLPESWDEATVDTSTADGAEAAAEIRARRARAGIGEQVRHREKWRLALDMLDEWVDHKRSPAVGDFAARLR